MKVFTKSFLTLLLCMLGVLNVSAQGEETALTADMFFNWNGYGADATATTAATVEFNVGNNAELGGGNVVCGTGTVDHLIYADLTGSTKIMFEGTPGLPLRVLMNRQESNNGPLTEKQATIGEDGKVEIDLSDLPYVHVNAIKVNWGEVKGTVSSIKFVKAAAGIKFDFNASNHATSSSSDTAGDITVDEVNTVNGVVMTITPNPSGTANRYWSTNKGPQLRMYGGTMTIAAPEGKAITAAIIDNGKWNENNTFNGETAAKGEWAGNSTNLVLAVAGNTQMNYVEVTLADKNDATTTFVDGGEEDEISSWDFTKWSDETIANLKADAAASKTSGWSDVEKKADAEADKDPTDISKDNCFWLQQAEAPTDGALTANGVVIKELKGLKFINSTVTNSRNIAIAVNYPVADASKDFGPYHGGSYFWVGGKNHSFIIPNVTAGSIITMEIESHKITDGRGVKLMQGETQIGDAFTPMTFESHSWTIENDGDVTVVNTNGCHIYKISISEGSEGPSIPEAADFAAFKALEKGTEAKVTLKDAYVTAVSGNNAYVQDASGALYFYNTGLALEAGKVLNGTVIGKLDIYNTLPEFTKTANTNAEGFTITDGTTTAKAVTVAEALTTDNVSMLVKVAGATITEEEGKFYAVDGDNKIQIYDQFKVLAEGFTYPAKATITGIVGMYKGTPQLYPLTANSIEEEASNPDEELAAAPEGWESLITNGNLAGDDVSCFFSKEAPAGNPYASSITEGAGKDKSRGIIVKSADSPSQTWDTQFFIRANKPIPAGTKLHMEFDYKASKAATGSTQGHGEPGAYVNNDGVGTVSFTTEWQHLSKDFTSTKDIQTIAFNLAEENTATEYYIDNIIFWAEKAVEVEWVDIVKNGNMEGENVSFFVTKIYPAADPTAATLTEGAGKTGKGLKIESPAQVVNPWDTQFWINLPVALEQGTKFKVEFDFKADAAVTSSVQYHALPGDYIGSWLDVAFTTDWQHFDKQGIAPAANNSGNKFQSIAFNLSVSEQAVTYYIDNVKLYLDKETAATGIQDVYSVKAEQGAVFDLQGRRVAKPAKGLYIINGKKIMVK